MSAPGRSPGRRPPPSEARLPLTGASSTASWHPAPVLQATPVQSQHRPPHEHPSPERSLPPSVPRTAYTRTHAHTCTQNTHAYADTHAHTYLCPYIHTCRHMLTCTQDTHAYADMHTHAQVRTHIHMHVCTHTDTHMQTHTCTRMDMHTHMHAHRDVHTHTALPSFQADGGESPP